MLAGESAVVSVSRSHGPAIWCAVVERLMLDLRMGCLDTRITCLRGGIRIVVGWWRSKETLLSS